MTLRNRVTDGLKWQAITIVGRQLLSLAIFGILARLLDPADFGLMGLTYLYLFLAGMLTDPGLGAALVQRANVEPEHWDTAFWFNVACATLLCLTTIIFANPLAALFGDPRLAPLLRWSSIVMVISAASFVQGSMFTREIDFRRPALRTLLAQIVGGAVALSMALKGYGVWALVGQQLTASTVGTIFLWNASSYRPAFRFSFAHLRALMSVSSTVFVNNVLSFFVSRLDQLVIGGFAGSAALGLYVVAGKLPDQVKLATQQPLFEVLVPTMSKLQHEPHRMTQAIYRGMEFNAVVVFAVLSGLAATSRDLIPVLFGSKWIAASGLCALISVNSLISTLHVFFYPALLASGLTWRYGALTVSNAIGVLVACLVGIQFGVTWLLVALIINSLVMIVPSLLLLRRQVGVDPVRYYKPCLAPACAAIIMATVIQATRLALHSRVHPWLELGCYIALGAAVYLVVLYLIRRATLQNLLLILRQAVPSVPPGFHQTVTAIHTPNALVETRVVQKRFLMVHGKNRSSRYQRSNYRPQNPTDQATDAQRELA